MNIYKKISICLLSLFTTSTALEATSGNDTYSIVKNNNGTINEELTEQNLARLQAIFLMEELYCFQKQYRNHLDRINKNLLKKPIVQNTINNKNTPYKNSIKARYPKGVSPYYNNQINGYPNVNKRRHSYSSRKKKTYVGHDMKKANSAPLLKPKGYDTSYCPNCHSCNQCTSSNFSPSQRKTDSEQQPMTLLATIIDPNNIIIIILYGLGYWVIVFRNKKQKKTNLLYLARRL